MDHRATSCMQWRPSFAAMQRSGVLQRACDCGQHSAGEGKCKECGQNPTSARKTAGNDRGSVEVPSSVTDVLRSPGQSLSPAVREFMEPRFGQDFSHVRVHADSAAASSARDVNASAWTVGKDIAFASGRYEPSTPEGSRLLAHELAHVAQQSAAGAVGLAHSGLEIGAAADPAEREAESIAEAIHGGAASVGSPRHSGADIAGPRLRRQGDDQPKKEPPPLIPLPHPFDRGDIKPLIPIPGIGNPPSLEDIHKGYYDLFGPKDKPASVKCPPGWALRDKGDVAGLCCPGASVGKDRCCPPYRMTILGVCCGEDEMAQGIECKKISGDHDKDKKDKDKKDQPGTAQFNLTLPPMKPLNVDFPIHFRQDMPGAVIGSAGALGASLTEEGKSELDTLIRWLKTGPAFSVQLTGMASVEGKPPHNFDLGARRAQSVARVLIQSGIAPDRIADPAGDTDACSPISEGIHNCGDSKAAKTVDPNDRQVRARTFIPTTPLVISGKG